MEEELLFQAWAGYLAKKITIAYFVLSRNRDKSFDTFLIQIQIRIILEDDRAMYILIPVYKNQTNQSNNCLSDALGQTDPNALPSHSSLGARVTRTPGRGNLPERSADSITYRHRLHRTRRLRRTLISSRPTPCHPATLKHHAQHSGILTLWQAERHFCHLRFTGAATILSFFRSILLAWILLAKLSVNVQ